MNKDKIKPLFIYGDTSVDQEQFEDNVSLCKKLIANHTHILIKTDNPLLFNTALIASYQEGKHLYICPSYYTQNELETIFNQLPIELFLTSDGDAFKSIVLNPNVKSAPTSSSAVYIFTSGTTGSPKVTQQQWDRIQHSSLNSKKLAHMTWLMTYSFHTYAGIQVFFSCYNNGGTLLYYKNNSQTIVEFISEHKVEVISATPTYWKMLINRWSHTTPPIELEQATIGGEIVNQDVIDLIQQFFNPKRLTHIYASTEAGTSIVVSDRLAGFPIEYLTKSKDIQLRVHDNKLEIKSPYAMTSYLNAPNPQNIEGWIQTGDLVEIHGNRIYFVGREDERINVGGLKVNPIEVEKALCQIEGILDCCIYAKPNPITGNIVAADVILKKGYQLDTNSIINQLKPLLADFKIPRSIKQVHKIEVSPNGKKIRHQ
ncbi:MAG: long-chain fatty acid--CoA ligase [Parachlamydiaceae bacterium]|nr:long-chain fatty acid--CoA ligase [Parachlamydiaceae bacterium]